MHGNETATLQAYHTPHHSVSKFFLVQTDLGHSVLGGRSETLSVRCAQQAYLLLTYRPLILNKQKVLLAAASSAYKHSLKEVMASQGIASQIKVRCAICVNVMQCKQLYSKHERGESPVCSGPGCMCI